MGLSPSNLQSLHLHEALRAMEPIMKPRYHGLAKRRKKEHVFAMKRKDNNPRIRNLSSGAIDRPYPYPCLPRM
jgi:hypothetical protein